MYGEWEFFGKKLVSPETSHEHKTTDRIQVSALWNDKEILGEKLEGSGFASFRLKVLFPDQKKIYSIRVGDMYSSYNLWIDGFLVAQNGIVGTSKETTRVQ